MLPTVLKTTNGADRAPLSVNLCDLSGGDLARGSGFAMCI